MAASGNPIDLLAGPAQLTQWAPKALLEFYNAGGLLKKNEKIIELKKNIRLKVFHWL